MIGQHSFRYGGLRAVRESVGVTQDELASKAGFRSNVYISTIETYKMPLSYPASVKITNAFKNINPNFPLKAEELRALHGASLFPIPEKEKAYSELLEYYKSESRVKSLCSKNSVNLKLCSVTI